MLEATEHQIQTQIINYLRSKGWYVMRLNTGKYSVGEGKYKRFVMGQEKGTPDVMAFKKEITTDGVHIVGLPITTVIFVEVKRPGKKPTFYQTHKMKELEEYGARCVVATDYKDLERLGI